jgi:DNA-binding LacI/PurR family transcriptional regulator
MAHETVAQIKDRGFRFVAAELGRRLLAKEWKAGESIPSLRKLSSEYQVGLKTVRLAARELLRQGLLTITRRHRLTVAEFARPSVATRKPILLVLGFSLTKLLQQTYSRDFLHGFFSGVERNNHDLLIFQGKPARLQRPVDLIDRPLHGVVLFGMLGHRVIPYYENLDCPVILADRPLFSGGVHRILADNIKSTFDSTQRLFDAGHTNIVLVYQKDPDSKERKMGFLAALTKRGKKRPGNTIIDSLADPAQNRATVRKLFTGRTRHTAAVATAEGQAKWLVTELNLLGLKVPRDVSLVCFQAKTKSPPEFSGPALDFHVMGRMTYEMLDEPRKPARLIRIPTEWVEANTIAPAK